MKTEDYNQLKKLCEDNGFELVTESPKENDKFYVVKKKDIWEGVDFCCFDNVEHRKIHLIEKDKIWFTTGKFMFKHEDIKPSTEQAYIEQLKKIAKDKFGEIKEGDRFQTDFGIDSAKSAYLKYHYNKNIDHFLCMGVIIYQQGKWAEKLPEGVKVEFFDSNSVGSKYNFKFNITGEFPNLHHLGDDLAIRIEKYLNNEL